MKEEEEGVGEEGVVEEEREVGVEGQRERGRQREMGGLGRQWKPYQRFRRGR